MESKEKELRNLPVVAAGVVVGASVVAGASVLTTEKKKRKIITAIIAGVYVSLCKWWIRKSGRGWMPG